MTIAQQLKIKEFPFSIKDSNGKTIYYEDSNGFWFNKEFDANGKEIYYENSKGYWYKSEYDANGKIIRSEFSDGFWKKREYDAKGNLIYTEDSNGTIVDNRPKVTLTLDEVAAKFGISVDKLQIKK